MEIDKKYTNVENVYSKILDDEISRSINTSKNFMEEWMRFPVERDLDMFHYGDEDFYFYRFAIGQHEINTPILLTNIIVKMLRVNKVNVVVNSDFRYPYAFTIVNNGKKIGYTFTNLDHCNFEIIRKTTDVDEAYRISTYKDDKKEKWISCENKMLSDMGLSLKVIHITDFYKEYFNNAVFNDLSICIEKYISDVKDIIGYKMIKFLSPINLASQKENLEKLLIEWPYDSYTYNIIDKKNDKMEKFLRIEKNPLSITSIEKMKEQYLSNTMYKTMLSSKDYAESFITSEWLYYSLYKKKNFDYTAIISGYLKSIEQLLQMIVMLNVDNNCKICLSDDDDIRDKALANNVTIYEYNTNKETWKVKKCKEKRDYPKFPYIDFTENQIEYMGRSMGTYDFFLKFNPHIFSDQNDAKLIIDMINCFRTECRNGFFHTHNLNDWSVVEKTRNNALYLYFVLLGSCEIRNDKLFLLDIIQEDYFDILCKKIREFSNYNTKFIFEYNKGDKKNMIYDSSNNTKNYTSQGVEHYDQLIFFETDRFEIDKGKRVVITRDNLPKKIVGVYLDGLLENIK